MSGVPVLRSRSSFIEADSKYFVFRGVKPVR